MAHCSRPREGKTGADRQKNLPFRTSLLETSEVWGEVGRTYYKQVKKFKVFSNVGVARLSGLLGVSGKRCKIQLRKIS